MGCGGNCGIKTAEPCDDCRNGMKAGLAPFFLSGPSQPFALQGDVGVVSAERPTGTVTDFLDQLTGGGAQGAGMPAASAAFREQQQQADANVRAGLDVATQTLSRVGDVIAAEQLRAREQQQQEAAIRLAQIRAQADVQQAQSQAATLMTLRTMEGNTPTTTGNQSWWQQRSTPEKVGIAAVVAVVGWKLLKGKRRK